MKHKPPKTAVVLLSGGLDSATTLAIATKKGYRIAALSFDYGQRHAREVAAAGAIARHYRVFRHETMHIDLRAFGGSALTANIAVPKDALGKDERRKTKDGTRFQNQKSKIENEKIPITYVPARNTVFLSFALGLAEVTGARDIFIGVNAIDYSGYPDCRPEFIQAFEKVANLGTKAGVEAASRSRRMRAHGAFHIHAPLIHLTKAQIIRTGLKLAVPYRLTHSCYDPVGPAGKACGHCDSCLLRLAGFREAGTPDLIAYASR